MPKLKNQLPKNCRDRNQAFSWYKGKRIYHGVWDSPDADRNYKRFIACLLENPTLPLQENQIGDTLVSELTAGFLGYVETRNMDKTDVGHFKTTTGYLVEIYGGLSVNEFSPKKLKVVRNQVIKAGTLSRPMVNRYVNRIRSIFSWGIEEEVISPNIVVALREVKALRKREQGTFDTPPREYVPDSNSTLFVADSTSNGTGSTIGGYETIGCFSDDRCGHRPNTRPETLVLYSIVPANRCGNKKSPPTGGLH